MFQSLRQKKQIQNEGRGAKFYLAFSYPLDICRLRARSAFLANTAHVLVITPVRTTTVEMITASAVKGAESKEFPNTGEKNARTHHGKQYGDAQEIKIE